MIKRVLAITFGIGLLSVLTANVMPLYLHLPGYHPLIDNQVDVYKLDKGIGFNKSRQYLIPTIAPTKKESIDLPNQLVTISTTIDDRKITDDRLLSFNSYFRSLRRKTFRKSLFSQVKTKRQQTVITTSGLIGEFKLELPAIAIPKAVQKVLGSSAGRLNLDGTQKITLEAGSTKRKLQPIYETSSSSRFDLKMERRPTCGSQVKLATKSPLTSNTTAARMNSSLTPTM